MTWVVLDDKMPEHPKNVGLSDGAFRLHVSAICYCNRHLTDGIISADMVAQLMPRYRKGFLDELLRRAVWVELVPDECYEIHDYWTGTRAAPRCRSNEKRRPKVAGREQPADGNTHRLTYR